MSARFVITLCFCSLLLVGCSSSSSKTTISKDKFLGTFAGEYRNDNIAVEETFVINSDGTYTIVWVLESGYVFTETGKIYLENGNTVFYYKAKAKIGTVKLMFSPVIWGDRKYLFNYSGLDDMFVHEFCNGISDGTTAQKDDKGELHNILSNMNNPGTPVFGEPELINGEKFCL